MDKNIEENNAETIIKVEELTKIFGEAEEEALQMLEDGYTKAEILEETGATVGVSEASFEVEKGEIFVIMGLSGSGKSTLVRMLNRLIEPTKGSIYVEGDNLTEMSAEELRQARREKISMVFQNFGLFPHRTVLENTVYGLEVQEYDEEEQIERAERALDNSGLLEYKDQYPDQLSGGMQQRVGLARALTNDPEIILMDEAFSALDPLIRRDMQDELIELQKIDQRTIIFITHDLNESLRLGDRILIMRDGEVVQIGTGEEILTNPANEYVRRFVEDVDRARVYTVENIMETPHPLILHQHTSTQALEKMDEDQLTNMLVINQENVLLGYVDREDVVQAVIDGDEDLEPLIKEDVPTISANTLINDVYEIIYDADTPLAVVGADQTLKGIVVRSSVLTALANEEGEESDQDV
jgi:glycine betaine/proline transport system ATP-binding protein